MEPSVAITPDKNFLQGSVNQPIYQNETWFEYHGIAVKVPRTICNSALVIFQGQQRIPHNLLDDASGWVFLVPLGTETYLTRKMLSRLGIRSSYLGVVVVESAWDTALNILGDLDASAIIFLAQNKPTEQSSENEVEKRLLNLGSSASLNGSEIIVFSPSQRTSVFIHPSVNLVAYDDSEYLGSHNHSWTWFLSRLSRVSDVLVGGGQLTNWLRLNETSKNALPVSHFLKRFDQSGGLSRTSVVEILLVPNELMVRGFDICQDAPAASWGSRKHSLFISGQGINDLEFSLGAMRREIWDNSPLSVTKAIDTYSGFALPRHEPISLKDWEPGEYFLRIISEDGYDLSAQGHILFRLPESELTSQLYDLNLTEEGIQLIIF